MRNFVKINEKDYIMISEPDESDSTMISKGFVKVDDNEFDRLFLLYNDVLNGELKISDIHINSTN